MDKRKLKNNIIKFFVFFFFIIFYFGSSTNVNAFNVVGEIELTVYKNPNANSTTKKIL